MAGRRTGLWTRLADAQGSGYRERWLKADTERWGYGKTQPID